MDQTYHQKFLQLLGTLHQESEIDTLLSALLLNSQYAQLIERFQILDLLLKGATHSQIVKQLECPSSLVSRMNQQLKYGDPTLKILMKQ